MNYGELISEAFRLTWRNRFLWVFGFFLGGSQSFNLFSNLRNLDRQGTISLGDEVRGFVSENIILIVALLVTLVLVGLFLSLVSQGALIDGIAALRRGEERRFSSALHAGLSNFWRVLGFTVLLILIVLVVAVLLFFLIGLPILRVLAGAFATPGSLSARIAVIVLLVLIYIVLFIVIFIPLGMIASFGLQTLVIGRAGVFGSFRNGYDLFRRHLGRSLLIFVIGFTLGLGSTITLLILALILGLILAAPAAILFLAGLTTAAVVAGVAAAVVLLVPYVVATGAVGTFNQAYWTLAYLQLTAAEGDAGLEGQPGT
jgi:hypothetical protein